MTYPLIALLLAFLLIAGCEKKEIQDPGATKAELARQDSLLTLLRSAGDRSVQQPARIVNPSAPAGKEKFSSFSDSAVMSAQKGSPRSAAKNSDTANTLESAIATNAKIIQVAKGSAEDRRLDSLMLIANTLSYRYQQMVMTHTHKNLAEAAHQDPAKTRRLLKTITEKAPEKMAQRKMAAEVRMQRLQALQNQMEQQNERQQLQNASSADTGK